MGRLLFLLFTVVPLLELYLLLLMGRLVGFWPTVGLVLLTGVLGASLAKAEGLRVFRRWQRALSEGRMPEEGVLEGVLLLVGGVFLVTPGVLTDGVGLLLLVPPSRRFVARLLRGWLERRIRDGQVRVVTFHGGGPSRRGAPPGIIEVEGEEIPPEKGPLPELP